MLFLRPFYDVSPPGNGYIPDANNNHVSHSNNNNSFNNSSNNNNNINVAFTGPPDLMLNTNGTIPLGSGNCTTSINDSSHGSTVSVTSSHSYSSHPPLSVSNGQGSTQLSSQVSSSSTSSQQTKRPSSWAHGPRSSKFSMTSISEDQRVASSSSSSSSNRTHLTVDTNIG